MSYEIYLSPPHMGGEEIEFIRECFDTNWIAPYGPQIDAFEREMAAYTGTAATLAVSSGTAALHLALRRFGVQSGDIVFCSDFTFIGSCGAVLYQNAAPVFIDSETDTWNMSPHALEKAFRWAETVGRMPKAVIIVDLYGESADWDSLLPICRKYNIPVIEDAAEAVGSGKCGTYGDVSILSFNGNKIITTSGGGMVMSDDSAAVDKMRFWSAQAREPFIHYEHKEFGYNYRMSNVCAAIGRGQLRFLDEKLRIRKEIYELYVKELTGIPAHIKRHSQKGSSNCWLNLLYIDTDRVKPADIVMRLRDAHIETRPAWKPMHMQPLFAEAKSFPHFDGCYADEDLFAHAVCLPSGDSMTEDRLMTVITEIKKCFE